MLSDQKDPTFNEDERKVKKKNDQKIYRYVHQRNEIKEITMTQQEERKRNT